MDRAGVLGAVAKLWRFHFQKRSGAPCVFDFRTWGKDDCTILYCLLYKLRDNIIIQCHAKMTPDNL